MIKKIIKSASIIMGILIGLFVILYLLATFTSIPLLSDARNIWIETAMTTGDHQWLATKFFPKSVVENVMNRQDTQEGLISSAFIDVSAEITDGREEYTDSEIKMEIVEAEEIENKTETEPVPIRQSMVGKTDGQGNKIIVDDLENGIRIVELKTLTFSGKAMFIENPAQVVVGHTKNKEVKGQLITDYLKDYDAIGGVNANGFFDPEGLGMGGEILGWSMSDGQLWGREQDSVNQYITMGFDRQDRLLLGNIKSFDDYDFRDLVQFKPALIVDGEIKVEGSAGWGIHPRTAIGQKADGSVMLIVIDGRDPSHSIGITVGELAKIMYSYGVINAGACDGGSSAVMAYDGELLTKPSTAMARGRYLPNAILVLKKEVEITETKEIRKILK